MLEQSSQNSLTCDTISDSTNTQHIVMADPISDSAQRGELPKLTDDSFINNYSDWSSKCYHSLRTWGLWKYIEGPTSTPPAIPPLVEATVVVGTDSDGVRREVTLPGNNDERERRIRDAQPWMGANDLTLNKLVSATPELQMHLVEDEIYAKQAWNNLATNYKPQNSTRASSIRGDITAYRCTTQMDVAQWLTDMQHMYGTCAASTASA
jgi:hypothetical protein